VDEILESYIAVISELTLVEFTSAVRKKANEGSIGNADVFRVLAKFHDDLDNFVILRFDTGIISKAMEFVLEYSLKTLDSLQLAFAVKLKDYDPLFVSFDQKLLQCAKFDIGSSKPQRLIIHD